MYVETAYMPTGALDSKAFAVGMERYALALVKVGKVFGQAKIIEAVTASFDVARHGALLVSASRVACRPFLPPFAAPR